MNKHLFDYNPTQEWNGRSVVFTNVTDDENTQLTGIVLSSEGAQEANSKLDQSRYTNQQYLEINKIIRDIFSGNQIDLVTFIGGGAGEEYEIESFFDVFMGGFDKGYEIFLDKEGGTFGQSSQFVDKVYLKTIEEPRNMSLSVGTINNGSNPAEHGMPYLTLSWSSGALTPRCENQSYSTQASCEASGTFYSCYNYNTGTELLVRKMQNPTVWTPAATVSSECITFNTNYCYYRAGTTGNWTRWSSSTYWCDRTANGSTYPTLYWLPKGTVSDLIVNPNSWWPSVETQNTLSGHVVYEGEGVYHLPEEFDQPGSAATFKTWRYDNFSTSGQMKSGRQTRVFYIGYLLNIDTKPHKTQINPDNYLHGQLPAHGLVNSTNSVVGNTYAYTTYYDRTRIRWRKPQYWANPTSYPTPDRYRIYRSNSYYYGITSPTEYTMGIKRLVGEVPSTSVNDDLQFFEESEHSLRAEGMLPYQYCYYYITSVWDDWGTSNRGLFYGQYNFYWDGDITAFDGQSPSSTYVEVLEIDQSGNDLSISHSQRWTGYFKAQKSGVHSFKLTSDDSAYLWIGNSGDDITTLSNNITLANALIDNGGTHPPTSVSATITLNEGEYYPILLFYGNKNLSWPYTGGYQNTLAFTPPGGVEQTSGVGYYFMSNNNSNPGTGQEVEGRFTTNQLRSYFR
jgi:hypothetical protein